MIESYDAALARIAADPRFWLTHPRPYPELARYGFRWIKLHRYWFAWHPVLVDNVTVWFETVERKRDPDIFDWVYSYRTIDKKDKKTLSRPVGSRSVKA